MASHRGCEAHLKLGNPGLAGGVCWLPVETQGRRRRAVLPACPRKLPAVGLQPAASLISPGSFSLPGSRGLGWWEVRVGGMESASLLSRRCSERLTRVVEVQGVEPGCGSLGAGALCMAGCSGQGWSRCFSKNRYGGAREQRNGARCHGQRQKAVSDRGKWANHRITEWWGLAGTSVGHPAQPPAQAGSPSAADGASPGQSRGEGEPPSTCWPLSF